MTHAFQDELYVELVPSPDDRIVPHPIKHAGFDADFVYRVLGVFNPSETAEAYLLLANQRRELWFISNRHVRAWGIIHSDQLYLSKVMT